MRVSRVQVKTIPPLQKRPALHDWGHRIPTSWMDYSAGGGAGEVVGSMITSRGQSLWSLLDTYQGFTHPQTLSLPPTQVLFRTQSSRLRAYRSGTELPHPSSPSAPMETSLTPLLAMKSRALFTLLILCTLILPRSGLGNRSPESHKPGKRGRKGSFSDLTALQNQPPRCSASPLPPTPVQAAPRHAAVTQASRSSCRHGAAGVGHVPGTCDSIPVLRVSCPVVGRGLT